MHVYMEPFSFLYIFPIAGAIAYFQWRTFELSPLLPATNNHAHLIVFGSYQQRKQVYKAAEFI